MNPANAPKKNHYLPEERERYWQDFWEEKGVFHFDPESTKPLYTIDTPPPTISGSLHLGHVYSYTQAEIIARYKRLAGFNVRYPFGYDNNGLPTERLVEKEHGLLGKDTPLKDFIRICLDTTEKYAKEFETLWRSAGLSVDWSLNYSTISPDVQKVSQSVFLELFERDIIYRESSPTLYCVECHTAVAQAEVEDKEKDSVFYDLAFSLEDGGQVMPIATTRPELLPACVAVFVHPDDPRYSAQVGKKIKTPLGVSVDILTDDKVEMEKGTGMVMCCTYGDETDRYWVKKHNLAEKTIINSVGLIENSIHAPQNGKTIQEARAIIVADLQEKGAILKEDPITHTVGVHERCGTPMELIMTDQWLIKILDKKEDLLNAGEQINWYPDHMKLRYRDWVEGLKWDWNISRDRFFGIPIPVFHCIDCKHMFTANADELPIDPRTDQTQRTCPKCSSGNVRPEKQLLDTWFTSALTPAINDLHPANKQLLGTMYPMSMRPMAHDIIRTWGVYTILMGLYRKNDIPWNDLMISGHILLRKGEKISKKTGGGKYKPQELISENSADAVRYAMCGANLGKDGFFDEAEVKKGKKLVTKIYNAGKFVLSHLADYDNSSMRPAQLEMIDAWIINRATDTSAKMAAAFDKYEYARARQIFEDFFWREFCDNYLEIIKGRLYNEGIAIEKRRSAQAAVHDAFFMILQLATPFIPHITEEMYHGTTTREENQPPMFSAVSGSGYFAHDYQVESINKTTWTKEATPLAEETQKSIESFMNILESIRKYRTEQKISLAKIIETVTIIASAEKQTALQPVLEDLISVTKIGALQFAAPEENAPSAELIITV